LIIEEKLKTGAPAIAIFNYIKKHHGYTGSYTTIKDFVRNLNIEKQKQAVIRFETNPGIQAQVEWKESMKFKTQDGDTIKFNVFLLIFVFSRTKFLSVTETRDLHTVEECLVKAFKYIGGAPPSPHSYPKAYSWIFVKGSKAACLPFMNVSEYATAEIVHFHLPFLYIFA